MTSPAFSIVIPVYNVAPYLRECLDSLRAQTFTDWEAICIDDGSTDGGGTLLDNYATSDRRFRVIHQSNAGVSAARNVGLQYAGGNYVGFVDGDDVIRPNFLKTADAIIRELSPDLIRFERQRWDGQEIPPTTGSGVMRLERNAAARAFGWRQVLTYDWGGVWSYCIHRSLIADNNIRLLDGMRMCEDRLFMLVCMQQAASLVCANTDCYLYRTRPGSACLSPLSTDDIVRYFTELASFVRTQKSQLREDGFFETSCALVSGSVLDYLKELLHHGNRSEWMHDRNIPRALSELRRNNILVLDRFPPKWSLALRLSTVSQTMLPFALGRLLRLKQR